PVPPAEGQDPGTKVYHAEFKAKWMKVFSSTQAVDLEVHEPPSSAMVAPSQHYTFSGTAALHTPVGKGTYHCEGILTPTVFQAKYDATYDFGFFTLGRP